MNLYTLNTNYSRVFSLLLLKFGILWVCLLSTSIIIGCSKDDTDSPDTSIGDGNSGNGGNKDEITLSQLEGYWVESSEWKSQQADIKYLNKDPYVSQMTSSDIISAIAEVSGFYINSSNEREYDMFIQATTIKYSNNSFAGNKVLASWVGKDGKTVYVMNVLGGDYSNPCRVNGKTFSYLYNSFTIKSVSEMQDSDGNIYVKVTL